MYQVKGRNMCEGYLTEQNGKYSVISNGLGIKSHLIDQ